MLTHKYFTTRKRWIHFLQMSREYFCRPFWRTMIWWYTPINVLSVFPYRISPTISAKRDRNGHDRGKMMLKTLFILFLDYQYLPPYSWGRGDCCRHSHSLFGLVTSPVSFVNRKDKTWWSAFFVRYLCSNEPLLLLSPRQGLSKIFRRICLH